MAANEQMDVSDDESFEEEYGSDEGEGFPGDEEEDEEMTEEEQAVATEEALARLANLQCSLEDAERETGEYEQAVVDVPSAGNGQAIIDRGARIPTLNGQVDKLQVQVDAVSGGPSVKTARKELVEKATALGARIAEVHKKHQAQATAYAEARKADGNERFADKKWKEAEGCYTEAIRMDRTNPVYYCNRASCRMALEQWGAAADDAAEAIKCDVNNVKSYVLLNKCRMQLGKPSEAADAILSAPMAVQRNDQLQALVGPTALAVKEIANAKYKAGAHDDAIEYYTQGAKLEPKNPVFPSNRSACYQAKRRWRDAVNSARDAVKADRTFTKGYLHLAKSLIQLNSPLEARHSLEEGLTVLRSEGLEENPQMATMLKELLAKEASIPSASTAAPAASQGATRADTLKEQGNQLYKNKQYPGALKLYTAAISSNPTNGALYGNRAACWMMMKEYQRAVDDCTSGLKYEQSGELGKVRARLATALVHLKKYDRAIDLLTEGVSKGGEHTATLTKQLTGLKETMAKRNQADAALESGEFRKAKTAFMHVVATPGHEYDAPARLGLAKALVGLEEYVTAAGEAQKALTADPNLQEAYLLRGDCLHFMGQTDKALQHLKAALQRDPDSTAVARRLKELRRINEESERVQSAIKEAHKKREYEECAKLAGEGLQIDPNSKAIQAKFYMLRAKALNNLAIKQRNSSDPEVKEKHKGSWTRSMQDASKAVYYGDDTPAPYLLRCGALQGLERWEEAVLELEECINKGPGAEDRTVHERLKEAQFAVKKSKRVDLYKLLNIENPNTCTEAEIKKAYKKRAMTLHPDKQHDKSDEEKKKAEEDFKKCGEAMEILTDPYTKQLWDEGHDLDSIKEKVEMRKQRGGGMGGHGGGFPGGFHFG